MRKLLPIILLLLGTGAGIAAGLMFQPKPDDAVVEDSDGHAPGADEHHEPDDHGYDSDATDYVKLNNQFVVSVVEEGEVVALVVMSLSLEVAAGQKETVFNKEPKLRDVFLQVLFEHANSGGFHGDFTRSDRMLILRDSLLETAHRTLGPAVTDVLIQDLVRQDL